MCMFAFITIPGCTSAEVLTTETSQSPETQTLKLGGLLSTRRARTSSREYGMSMTYLTYASMEEDVHDSPHLLFNCLFRAELQVKDIPHGSTLPIHAFGLRASYPIRSKVGLHAA